MEPQIQPAPAQAPAVQKSNKTILVLIGIFVLALAIFGAVYFLFGSSKETPRTTTTNSSDTINSAADLDKAAKTLDSQDLDGYEKDLNANDKDVSAF